MSYSDDNMFKTIQMVTERQLSVLDPTSTSSNSYQITFDDLRTLIVSSDGNGHSYQLLWLDIYAMIQGLSQSGGEPVLLYDADDPMKRPSEEDSDEVGITIKFPIRINLADPDSIPILKNYLGVKD